MRRVTIAASAGAFALAACAAALDLPEALTFPAPAADGGNETGVPTEAGAGDDLACARLGSAACLSCCTEHHATGATTFYDALLQCACTPPRGVRGKCQAACANSDCSEQAGAPESTPGDPRYTCQEQQYAATDGGGCGSSYAAACAGGADCLAFVTCFDRCP